MRNLTPSELNLIEMIVDSVKRGGAYELTVTARVPLSSREYDISVHATRQWLDVPVGATVRYKGRAGYVRRVGRGFAELEMPDGLTTARTSELVVLPGSDKPGRAMGFETLEWLPAMAVRLLVNWKDERVAAMTDFPDSTASGMWHGFTESPRKKQWAIFDRFVKPMVEGE